MPEIRNQVERLTNLMSESMSCKSSNRFIGLTVLLSSWEEIRDNSSGDVKAVEETKGRVTIPLAKNNTRASPPFGDGGRPYCRQCVSDGTDTASEASGTFLSPL